MKISEHGDLTADDRDAKGWLGVEPRHLVAFVAVERAGSFRAAAAELGLVQSALSQRVAQLEQLVGARLLVRSRGRSGLRLTQAGRLLLGHAEAVVAQLDAALCDLRCAAENGRAALRVGTFERVSRRLLPGALQAVASRLPDVAVELCEDADWRRFFSAVAVGELDVGFAELPLDPGPFASRELAVDPWVLVVRADSPLARAACPPSLAEVGALPLVALREPRLDVVAERLRAAGVEPRFVFGSTSAAGVQELVAQGAGAAFMPQLCVAESDPRVAVLALDDALPARRLAVYWHRGRRRTEAIECLVAALEELRHADQGTDAVDRAVAGSAA